MEKSEALFRKWEKQTNVPFSHFIISYYRMFSFCFVLFFSSLLSRFDFVSSKSYCPLLAVPPVWSYSSALSQRPPQAGLLNILHSSRPQATEPTSNLISISVNFVAAIFFFFLFYLEENPFLIELQEADSCSIWLLPFVPCRLGFQSSRPFVVISTALILLFLFKLFILHTPWVRVLILFDSLSLLLLLSPFGNGCCKSSNSNCISQNSLFWMVAIGLEHRRQSAETLTTKRLLRKALVFGYRINDNVAYSLIGAKEVGGRSLGGTRALSPFKQRSRLTIWD